MLLGVRAPVAPAQATGPAPTDGHFSGTGVVLGGDVTTSASMGVAGNNPASMLAMKNDARTLRDRMPVFRESLSQHYLNEQEVADILKPLNDAIATILGSEVAGDATTKPKENFREPTSYDNHRYNTLLLAALSADECTKLSVPDHIAVAVEKHKLGFIDKVKIYRDAAAYGAGAALVTGVAMGALTSMMSYATGMTTSVVAPVSATSAFAAGVGMATTVYRKTMVEHEERKLVFVKELQKYYDGIADYLKENSAAPGTLKLAEKLKERLPAMNLEIAKTGIESAAGQVTAKLQAQVDSIVAIAREAQTYFAATELLATTVIAGPTVSELAQARKQGELVRQKKVEKKDAAQVASDTARQLERDRRLAAIEARLRRETAKA